LPCLLVFASSSHIFAAWPPIFGNIAPALPPLDPNLPRRPDEMGVSVIGVPPNHSFSGWWFQPLWKILVNGKDYSIYYMENKTCLKPPTSIYIILYIIYTPWKLVPFHACVAWHKATARQLSAARVDKGLGKSNAEPWNICSELTFNIVYIVYISVS
jgi:hypothetical protein